MFELRTYQKEAVKWLSERRNCLLCDEMGVGKTPTIISSYNEQFGLIVVMPPHLIFNWKNEFSIWNPNIIPIVIKTKKDFFIPEPGQVILMSYGMLPEWVIPQIETDKNGKKIKKRKSSKITEEIEQKFKKCWIVFDEFHKMTNYKTKQSQICKQIVKFCNRAIGLTGTPLRNKPFDLWSLLSILRIENQVFKSFKHFIFLFGGKPGFFGGYVFPKDPKIHPEVSNNLEKIMLRRTKKEVFTELPDEIYSPVYYDVEGDLLEKLNSSWDFLKSVSNFSDLTIPDFSEMAGVKASIAKSNISKMIELVEDYEEKEIPIIVGSAHREPLLELKKRKGWDIIIGGMNPKDKFKVCQDFQDGKLKGIGVSLKAGAEGLNLTKASTLIFNDRDWVPAINNQFIARINRIGQESKKLYIRDIINDHPLTQHIYRLNLNKELLSGGTIDKNEGFKHLNEEIEKTSEVGINDIIIQCLPMWKDNRTIINGNKDEIEKMYHLSIFKLNDSDDAIVRLIRANNLYSPDEINLAYTILKNSLT